MFEISSQLESRETLRLMALGQPMEPGILYDDSTKTVVASSLWDRNVIRNATDISHQHSSGYKFIEKDTMEARKEALGIKGDFDLDMWYGNISGAAEFLKHKEKTSNIYRCTMHSKLIIQFRQLAPTLMNHIKYPNRQKDATHLITGATYGAQAFFVFDRVYEKGEDKSDQEYRARAAINEYVRAGAHGHISEETQEEATKIDCSFYGDIAVNPNPTSIEECVNYFKNMPEMLGEDGEKAVPIEAYLMPLPIVQQAGSGAGALMQWDEGFPEIQRQQGDLLVMHEDVKMMHVKRVYKRK